MTDATKFHSKPLQTLDEALENGNGSALVDFWKAIKTQSTPLIEPVEDDEDHVWATFLYDAAAGDENICLISSITFIAGQKHTDWAMTRLRDTALYYRTEKLRADVLTLYSIIPNHPTMPIPEMPEDERKAFMKRFASGVDRFNPHQYIIPADEEDPEDFPFTLSIIRGPRAKPQPHVAVREGMARGSVEKFTLDSAVYENSRPLWVYTPPGYDATAAEPYPFLLLFDGGTWVSFMSAATLLNNLIAEGAMPPTVCVMLDCAKDARVKELCPSDQFITLIQDELLPWLRERYHITADPARSIVSGVSLGGLAAAWVGLKCSHLFGSVLSQSGSFWWFPKATDPEATDDETGWLIRRYVEAERLPLRFYMEVGLLEYSHNGNGASHRGLNRHMRDVLRAKGYPLIYTEYNGGHDYIWWQQTLADGLIALHTP